MDRTDAAGGLLAAGREARHEGRRELGVVDRAPVAFGRGCVASGEGGKGGVGGDAGEYRRAESVTGPLFLGMDTHALSVPARASALEVLAANGVTVMIAEGDEYTPTPAVSHAILAYNRGRKTGVADGIVITPSHNPPADGGFKYNPPHGGPAGTPVTQWIEARANEYLERGLRGVHRVSHDQALAAPTTHRGPTRWPLTPWWYSATSPCSRSSDATSHQAVASCSRCTSTRRRRAATADPWLAEVSADAAARAPVRTTRHRPAAGRGKSMIFHGVHRQLPVVFPQLYQPLAEAYDILEMYIGIHHSMTNQ